MESYQSTLHTLVRLPLNLTSQICFFIQIHPRVDSNSTQYYIIYMYIL